jgi:hypothetical protein
MNTRVYSTLHLIINETKGTLPEHTIFITFIHTGTTLTILDKILSVRTVFGGPVWAVEYACYKTLSVCRWCWNVAIQINKKF